MHHHHPYDPAIAERKQKNRDIFAETMRICRRGGYVTPSGAEVRLPGTDEVLKASVFYQNPPAVDSVAVVESCVCDAVNDDCIEVARKLVADGYSPILLNMANRHTPGGGVINGARAQEESLFRQSNLCVSLYQFDEYHAGLLGLPLGNGRYPMDRDTGGIYSGRVTFFRTSSRKGDALVETPFECAVVSVAAINRPDLTPDGRLVDWAVVATKKKIRTMLRIGLLHSHDAIVLGAWGCGAFRNPPEHMARLFHEVLEEDEFARKYRIVRFAVIEDHNSRHSNFAPFDKEFNGKPQMDVGGAPGVRALPSRKPLDHRGPLWVDVSDAIYFITIAAAERGGTMLIDNADTIMNAARFYQDKAKWFLYLFLIMPDHIHMLVHVPPTSQLSDVIGHWKSYLATQKGIRFQVNFFDTRIRDAVHYAEKWNYICQNPVARGLVEAPREWKYVIAFDPATGEEREHR